MKKNAKMMALSLCAVIALTFCLAAAFVTDGNGKDKESNIECSSLSSAETFILKEYNGNVAVFSSNDDSKPIAETDINVSGLRASDREKLEKGIETENYEQIIRLIEDFGS